MGRGNRTQDRKAVESPSIYEAASWLAGFTICTIAVPAVLLASASGADRVAIAAMFSSIFILEYIAPAVGIGLGLDPLRATLITVSVTFGICMLITGMLCLVGASSRRAARFLASVHRKMEKYPRFMTYGPAANLLFVIILGMYIAPGISFLVGWSRGRSAAFMFAGIMAITALLVAATMGIIHVFFA